MDSLKLVKRTLKYKAHRVKVYEDTLETPEGQQVHYDFVENRNGSAVLLVDENGKLLFVKQYRNCVNRMDIEMPAGCAELPDFDSANETGQKSLYDAADKFTREDFESADNPFYICAMREAEEETGYIPGKLTFINYIIAAVGLFSERTAVYIGTELKKGEVSLDDDEYIEVIRLTLDDALKYIHDGMINDSKTVLAIYAYAAMKSGI